MALAGTLWCAGELMLVRGGMETWTGMRLVFLAEVLVGPMWLGVAAHLAQIPLY